MPASAPPSFVSPGDPTGIADRLAEAFTKRTGSTPSVVAVAPGRVNLIGEHLDYNAAGVSPSRSPTRPTPRWHPERTGLSP